MADLKTIQDLVQDVKDQLDDIEKNVKDLVQFKAVHIEAHKAIEARQISFKKTLYGDDNGTGLTYEVQRLVQCKKNLKTSSERWRNFWISILKTLATAAIIAVTAWLLCLYKSQGAADRATGAEITQPAGEAGPQ